MDESLAFACTQWIHFNRSPVTVLLISQEPICRCTISISPDRQNSPFVAVTERTTISRLTDTQTGHYPLMSNELQYSCSVISLLYTVILKNVQHQQQQGLVFLLRMCQMHKHIQSHIKHLNEIKNLIKNIHRVRKKRPRYFQLRLQHFLVNFYNFCTIGNRNEYFTIICNLLT